MKSGIYRILNLINGRCYFGQTKDFEVRFKKHVRMLRGRYHENPYLQNDWDKCGGLDNTFIYETILYCDENNLDFYEQKFLDKFWDGCKNCYNINPIAIKPPSPKGKIRSAEHNKKLGDSKRGKTRSAETIKKMSESLKGQKHSEETKRKMSLAAKGRICSVKTRQKISQLAKGRKHSEQTKNKMSIAKRKMSEETKLKMSRQPKTEKQKILNQ